VNKTEIEAIKARYEAATPGEWEAYNRGLKHDFDVRVFGDDDNEIDITGWYGKGMFGRFADADFVAHAHQDIPALVAEVERLQALVNGESYRNE
jgi:hypothetical protein